MDSKEALELIKLIATATIAVAAIVIHIYEATVEK